MTPPTHTLRAFFGGLPGRVPKGDGDDAVAAREAISRSLAELNAHMLGREADHRVPVDIDAITEQILDRMKRYTTADWNRGNPPNLAAARSAMDTIAAQLRSGGDRAWADLDADDDEDE